MKKFINKHNGVLNLSSIHDEFGVPKKGIIHIGAHFGNEIKDYNEIGYKNIIFVEPASQTFKTLKSNVELLNSDEYCKISFINKAFGSYIGEVEMFTETANQGQSSSILEPGFHLVQYPGITFTSKEMVQLTTLNNEIKNIDGEFNLLNIDVQGYELEVLKGSTDILPKIDFINTEVNKVEVYKGCALINQIDDFLGQYGFVKIDENWMGDVWGDAMYIKSKFLKNE
jgi:FkbM family methyltransferase